MRPGPRARPPRFSGIGRTPLPPRHLDGPSRACLRRQCCPCSEEGTPREQGAAWHRTGLAAFRGLNRDFFSPVPDLRSVPSPCSPEGARGPRAWRLSPLATPPLTAALRPLSSSGCHREPRNRLYGQVPRVRGPCERPSMANRLLLLAMAIATAVAPPLAMSGPDRPTEFTNRSSVVNTRHNMGQRSASGTSLLAGAPNSGGGGNDGQQPQ